jgi:serine/threonine protein kinase
MGEVYQARDTRLDRTVAAKVSREAFGERFRNEALSVAALNHPHICTLHDVGPDYLVMEYVEGKPLQGPRPLAEALRLAREIADALEHAHAHGIVHGDLKPSNILVTKNGAKVLDFGVAKRRPPAAESGSAEATFTDAGTLVGTRRGDGEVREQATPYGTGSFSTELVPEQTTVKRGSRQAPYGIPVARRDVEGAGGAHLDDGRGSQ